MSCESDFLEDGNESPMDVFLNEDELELADHVLEAVARGRDPNTKTYTLEEAERLIAAMQ